MERYIRNQEKPNAKYAVAQAPHISQWFGDLKSIAYEWQENKRGEKMDGKQMKKNLLGVGTMRFVLTRIFSVGSASASGPTWTAKPSWDALSAGVAAPAFADLDGDGDYDLLIGERNGDYYAYENTAPPADQFRSFRQ